MNETILIVEDIHLRFGRVEALEEVSFEAREGGNLCHLSDPTVLARLVS